MSARDPIPSGTRITTRTLNRAIKGARTEVIGGVGVAVVSNGQQAVVSPRERKPQRFVQWLATVVSSVRDGENWRWVYTIRERIKDAPGYGGWIDRPNGREGDAYAWAEDINGPDGLLGNGIDTANLPGTFEPQPVPDGSAIIVTEVTLQDETATKEWWFERVTGPDGGCGQPLGANRPGAGV